MQFIKNLKVGSTVATLAVVIFSLGLVGVVVYFIAINFNLRPTVDVTINGGVYRVWTAKNDKTREKGLSGETSLKSDGGLLLAFPSDDYWGIWMKDMKVPIDILWLDSSKQVVYIARNVSPDLSTDTVLKPKSPARYVLEIPAGSADNVGIHVGQTAEFTLTGEVE